MSDELNNGPTQTETLLGGAKLLVKSIGDTASEEVSVRQLAIKHFPKLMSVIDDELKIAELYCDKPTGWAETLSMESLEAVIVEGERINQDFFSRWAQRRLNRQEKLMPGVTEKMVRAATASASPTGSPTPASPAA